MAKDPQQSLGGDILASDFDWFGTATGGTAYAVSMDGVGTAYNEGRLIAFAAGSANVGTATLSVNSIGAKNIKIWGASGLQNPHSGEIAAGQIVVVTYDATNDCFIMVSPPAEIDPTQSASVSVSGSGTSFTQDDTGVITVTLQRAARVLLQFAGVETPRSANSQAQSFNVIFNVDNAGTLITGYSESDNLTSNYNNSPNASCSVMTALLAAGTHTFRMRVTGSSSSSMSRGISGTLYASVLKG